MEENIELYNRIPAAIRIDKDKKVSIEELIGKVAIAQQFVLLLHQSEELLELTDDRIGRINDWAVMAILRGLEEVQHALKCGLYGYEHANHR